MARNKLVGQPRPPEVREKISRAQQERHRKLRAHGVPPKKRCSRCGVVKDSPKEFGWQKRTLKSGEVVYYPRSMCKVCIRAKGAAYRERLRKEGKLHDKQKEWNATRRRKKQAAEAQRAKERERMDKRNGVKRARRAKGAKNP